MAQFTLPLASLSLCVSSAFKVPCWVLANLVPQRMTRHRLQGNWLHMCSLGQYYYFLFVLVYEFECLCVRRVLVTALLRWRETP